MAVLTLCLFRINLAQSVKACNIIQRSVLFSAAGNSVFVFICGFFPPLLQQGDLWVFYSRSVRRVAYTTVSE